MILYPILLLCKNGLAAYRTAVFVNMMLQCVSFLLLWKILNKVVQGFDADSVLDRSHQGMQQEILPAFCMSAFYPVWVFYAQMTLTENMLFFLYLAICWLLMSYLEKQKLYSGILLLLSLLYIYFVHMRTVGVIAAAVVTLLFYGKREKKVRKQLLVYGIVFFLGILLGKVVKASISESVYATADAASLSVNDYAGQIEKVKQFFSVQGVLQFFLSCAGKIYYMGMASFGFFYTAVGYAVRQVRKKSSVYLFLLLSVCGQLFVSAFFMWNPGRLDGFVYGRYNDFLLPVLMGLGIMVFLQEEYPLRALLKNLGISFFLWLLSVYAAWKSGLTSMQGYFAAGISYLPEEREYQVIPEFGKAFLFGALLMIVMACGIWFGTKRKKEGVTIACLLLFEITLVFLLNQKYTYAFGDGNYEKLRIYNYIEDYQDTGKTADKTTEISVSYLYHGGQPYIDLIQFMLQENSIYVIREKEQTQENNWETLQDALPTEGFLIVDTDSAYLEKIEQKFEKCTESNDFVLFHVSDKQAYERH